MDLKILSSIFTLDNYTEIKIPEEMLDIIFGNELQFLGEENAQEKCKGLVFPFARSPLRNVAIKSSNVLLEPKSDTMRAKDIREMTLDGKDFKEYEWQPGDTIAILPRNDDECVDELLTLLELEEKADTICFVKISTLCTKKTVKIPTHIPTPTTPREILRDCLNLRSILSKKFLRSLAEYCTDEEEKKFLKCLSSKESSDIYYDIVMKGTINLIDILKVCKTCKPPLSLIVEYLARLLPRPYSIANSPLKTNEEITFIFSTLELNPGLTTKMLKEKSLEESSSSVLIYLREPNYFRYTEDNYQQNQILIAIGTGLAPFLGFLQHKQQLMRKNKEKPGVTWLFVGTTTQLSVIHRYELLDWQSQNILNNFVECYSRSLTARFSSVQEALLYHDQELVELLMKPETYLYLCADGGQITKSIEQSLQYVLSEQLTISNSESIEMLQDFKTKKKYREDTWL